jgi:UDP-N-acetylglucosamine--N-acetylmuramyl-(pentapeptide) pyrophosphoryl-undecaprenol N-acetylglucosamine transferase
MTKRLLVMAGGTGGHVFPGLAVADLLSKKQWQIHWLGTRDRMEAQLVPKAGFPISFIDVAGVRKNGLLRLLAAPFKIAKSIWQARQVISRFEPDVVLGLGGFASGPGGVAAWLCGKPLVVHEQNAAPGMTNRILARLAKRVLTGFAGTFSGEQSAPQKYQWVGNPVRAEFSDLPTKTTITLPLNILVVGGSLGAHVLNEVVPQALATLGNVAVRHQTGQGHISAVNKAYQQYFNNGQSWQASEFIDDMAAAYQWADVVVCRAGALTVAEVAAAGVCAIFVPLPYAVDDHQSKNAQILVKADAAFLLPQADFNPASLARLIAHCVAQPQDVLVKSQHAKQLARLDATAQVANICEQLTMSSQL